MAIMRSCQFIKLFEVATITYNYFQTGGGTVGWRDASGRDTNGTAVWRIQIVYVHPDQQSTSHFLHP